MRIKDLIPGKAYMFTSDYLDSQYLALFDKIDDEDDIWVRNYINVKDHSYSTGGGTIKPVSIRLPTINEARHFNMCREAKQYVAPPEDQEEIIVEQFKAY